MRVQQKFCPRHGPVAAVKNTHLLRNTASIAFLGIGSKVEDYMCPICGSPVNDHSAQEVDEKWREEMDRITRR